MTRIAPAWPGTTAHSGWLRLCEGREGESEEEEQTKKVRRRRKEKGCTCSVHIRRPFFFVLLYISLLGFAQFGSLGCVSRVARTHASGRVCVCVCVCVCVGVCTRDGVVGVFGFSGAVVCVVGLALYRAEEDCMQLCVLECRGEKRRTFAGRGRRRKEARARDCALSSGHEEGNTLLSQTHLPPTLNNVRTPVVFAPGDNESQGGVL